MSRFGTAVRVLSIVAVGMAGLVCGPATSDPLQVMSVSPRDGQERVDVRSNLEITFNHEVWEYSLRIGEPSPRIVLTSTEDGLSVDLAVTARDNHVLVDPVGVLAPNTTYEIAIHRGIQGPNGAELPTSMTSYFATGGDVEWYMSVTDADVAVTIDESMVKADVIVTLDHDLDYATVTSSSCVLRDPALAHVPCSLDKGVEVGPNQIGIKPVDDLREGETYTVTLTRDIVSEDGASLLEDYTLSFAAQQDTPTPELPVACGEPTVLEVDTGYGLYPDLGGDGLGNAMIVWLQEELSSTSSAYIRRPYVVLVDSDGTLTAPLRLVEDAQDQGAPSVSMNAEGEAIVAGPYRDPTSSLHGFYAKHYDTGLGWDAAVSGPPASHAVAVRGVQAGLDAEGNALVAYLVEPTATIEQHHIEYSTYSATAASWEAPVTFQTSLDLGEPRVAMSAAGEAMVVTYQDEDGGGLRVLSLPSTETRFDDAGWSASQPEASVDADGDGFIVWRVESSNDARIRTAPVAGCVPEETAAFLDGDQPGLCCEPAIAVGHDGTAVAVWELRNPPAGYAIRASRYAPSTGWSAPVTIDMGVGMLLNPQVSVGAGGLTAVTWQGPEFVYVAYATGDGRFTDPIVVSELSDPLSVYYAINPVVFVNPFGAVTTAYELSDAGIQDVYATVCD